MEQQTGYRQIKMRDNYRKQYSSQRNKNLVHLRFDIAKMNLSEFANRIGIVKSNLSEIEDGKRDLSIGNIHSYRTYFKDKHNLIVSTDYLLGYTDIIENKSVEIEDDLKLTGKSFYFIRDMADKQKNIFNKVVENCSVDHIINALILCYCNEFDKEICMSESI